MSLRLEPRAEAARLWAHRSLREREATDRFARLAAGLRATGASDAVCSGADEASRDEARHERLCAQLATALGGTIEGVAASGDSVAPRGLSAVDALLYDVVATCCVAETINVALLSIELEHAREGQVRKALHELLGDEVRHAKVGWAHLSDTVSSRDVRHLARELPSLLRGALTGGDVAGPAPEPGDETLRAELGLLSRETTRDVLRSCVMDVIVPGFRAHGLATDRLSADMLRLFERGQAG